jgi:hypothetical protein
MPVFVLQAPVVPQLYLPQGASAGSVHTREVIRQSSEYTQLGPHVRTPVPSEVMHGSSSPGSHGLSASMHSRRPVAMSQSPVTPQLYLPHAAPAGSLHSKLVIVQPVGHPH